MVLGASDGLDGDLALGCCARRTAARPPGRALRLGLLLLLAQVLGALVVAARLAEVRVRVGVRVRVRLRVRVRVRARVRVRVRVS